MGELNAEIELSQCDESCHKAGLDTCSKCDTLRWDLMCDSCRSYAAQDGA